jgi:hypothetical protein
MANIETFAIEGDRVRQEIIRLTLVAEVQVAVEFVCLNRVAGAMSRIYRFWQAHMISWLIAREI